MHKTQLEKLSVILMLLATLSWGASYLFMKQSLLEITPYNLIFWRFGIAFILTATVFIRQLLKTTLQEFIHGVYLGAILALAFYLVMSGLYETTTGNAGFILGCTSIFVICISSIIKRKLSPRIIIAAVMSVTGIGIMTLPHGMSAINRGDLLCLCSAALYAVYIIISSYYLKHDNYIRLSIIQFASAAITAGLLSQLSGGITTPQSQICWLAVLFLGIFCSAAGFIMQMFAQKHLPADYISILYLAEPVFAMSCGIIFLNETISWNSLAGATLILGGITLSSMRFKFRRTESKMNI